MDSNVYEREIVEKDKIQYRVLCILMDFAILIEMDPCKTHFEKPSIKELNDDYALVEVERNNEVVDMGTLSEKTQKKYSEMEGMAKRILEKSSSFEWLLNCKERSAFIEKEVELQGVSINTVRRRFRKYLQNGMSMHGLEAKFFKCGGRGKEKTYSTDKRPGKPGISNVVLTEETKKNFDKAMARYKQSGGKMSTKLLYEYMIAMEYSTRTIVDGNITNVKVEPFPMSQLPTIHQLRYHMRKNLNNAKKYALRHGERAASNNIRPILSDTIEALEVKTIGACYEMDEVKTDYQLVYHYNRNQVIGEAVWYSICDVFSKTIVGYAVGIDDNSWAGAEMAFLNMVENKVEVCKNKGINIHETDWPGAGYLPSRIQVDNGSEYTSNQFEKYAIDNGIIISYARAAMGSLKGNIESKFRKFNCKTVGLVPGYKDDEEFTKASEAKARLTIEEFEKVIVHFILGHNKEVMKDYKDTKELFMAGIEYSPNAIWSYCEQRENSLKRVVDFEAYKISLLCNDTALINRTGITYKGMTYVIPGSIWLNISIYEASANKKGTTINIKYDKRCLDEILVKNPDGFWEKAYLNTRNTSNEKYEHLHEWDIDSANDIVIQRNKKCEEHNMRVNVKLISNIISIVKTANKAHKGRNVSKQKQATRMLVKAELHKKNNVINKINGYFSEPLSLSEPTNSITTASNTDISLAGVQEDAIKVEHNSSNTVLVKDEEENNSTTNILLAARRKKYSNNI